MVRPVAILWQRNPGETGLFRVSFLGDACGDGPVFFVYKRVGRNGITFRCPKCHTMVAGAEECLAEYLKYRLEAAEEWKTQRKLAFDRRITTLGAFLRKIVWMSCRSCGTCWSGR